MATCSTITIICNNESTVTLKNNRASVVTVNSSQRGPAGEDGGVLQQDELDDMSSRVSSLEMGIGELDYNFEIEIVTGLSF